MKKIFCDFCGREIKKELDWNKLTLQTVQPKLLINRKMLNPSLVIQSKPKDLCYKCAKEVNLLLSAFESAWSIVIAEKEGQTCEFDDLMAEVVRLTCLHYSFGRTEEITMAMDEVINLCSFLKVINIELGKETKLLKLLKRKAKWIAFFEGKLTMLQESRKE